MGRGLLDRVASQTGSRLSEGTSIRSSKEQTKGTSDLDWIAQLWQNGDLWHKGI
jgi:hypothetical protein